MKHHDSNIFPCNWILGSKLVREKREQRVNTFRPDFFRRERAGSVYRSGSERRRTLVTVKRFARLSPLIEQIGSIVLFRGAGGGIRTHEGLRHRVLSPWQTVILVLCPFDLAMVPPRFDGAPGGSLRGKRPLLNPRSTALEVLILRRHPARARLATQLCSLG